jgi:hypothetical protein
MQIGLRRRLAAGIAAVAVAAFGVGVAGIGSARGATTHRAAVVVEVDGVIHTAKVTFASESISGLDALRAAGFAPSVRVFGGNGGAVCALDVGGTTIGCPADNTCLKCSADSDYWAYWRALSGATKYTYSPAGASSTTVQDGDVEAWNWSTGSAPAPFVSFADVWGSAPTTTKPPVTSPHTTRPRPTPSPIGPLGSDPPATTGGPASPAASTPTTATAVAPGGTSASTTGPRRSPTSTVLATETSVRAADGSSRKVATAPVVARGGGGSSWGLVGFAAILVVLLVAIVFARRRRTSSSPTI